MEHYLPFWAGAVALAVLTAAHKILTGRNLGVAGRVSAVVDALRGKAVEAAPEMSEGALMAALLAATRDAFSDEEIAAAEARAESPAASSGKLRLSRTISTSSHLIFLVGLVVGGVVGAIVLGDATPSLSMKSEAFTALFSDGPLAFMVLFAGGILVGIGTRMAAGCPTGHALSGLGRLQVGSLVSTMAFFAIALGTSFLLEALR